jgi:uncharacterized protein YcnI
MNRRQTSKRRTMQRHRKKSVGGVVATAVILLLWAPPASAHVTISPLSVPQGSGDVVLGFRVPNESTTASVTAFRIQVPTDHPIAVLSPEAVTGWTVTEHQVTLVKPVTTDDGTFTSVVSEVDWTGGTVPIGQFAVFNLLAQGIPSSVHSLVFKAVQQYSDGTTVSWIQLPDRAVPNPAHPAPVLTLTSPGSSVPSAGPVVASTGGGATVTSTTSNSGLVIVSLIVSGFALLAAILAVWLSRPKLVIGESRPSDDSTVEPTHLVD